MAANILPANQGGMRPHPRQSSEDDSYDDHSVSGPEDKDSEEFHFVESTHPTLVLNGLNDLRKSGSFCDVTLCVDGIEFHCHRIVLASFSPYFKAMFGVDMAESKQDKISINGVEHPMIDLLVNYAYTSKVTITKTNVQSLLSAANLLEVLPVRDACCQFLERNMEESNCIGIHCFAEAHACIDLQQKAKQFILKFWLDVCQQEELLALTPCKMREFVSDDELCVESEEVVFDAVMRWQEHDPEVRSQEFHKVSQRSNVAIV